MVRGGIYIEFFSCCCCCCFGAVGWNSWLIESATGWKRCLQLTGRVTDEARNVRCRVWPSEAHHSLLSWLSIIVERGLVVAVGAVTLLFVFVRVFVLADCLPTDFFNVD